VKIVSRFRDYYDSAQAYGHDDSRVYLRETRELTLATNAWPYSDAILQLLFEVRRAYGQAPGLLLFSGTAWPVWRENKRWADGDPFANAAARTHTFPGWQRHFARLRDLPVNDPERKDRERSIDAYDGKLSSNTTMSEETMIENHQRLAGRRVGEDLLIGERAPIALVLATFQSGWSLDLQEKVLVIVNPNLQDLDFHRLVDPFAAYQAIETFIGNQLAEDDAAPLRVGSDEVVARQIGFDEMSFRTAAPGAKKAHRKANRDRKRGHE
jgi:hypothetical protein